MCSAKISVIRFRVNKPFLWLLVIFIAASLIGRYHVQAEGTRNRVTEVRTIYPSEWGVGHPVGLAYSANLNQFFMIANEGVTQPTIVALTPYEELVQRVDLPFLIGDALNITFDDTANRLLLLNRDLTALIQLSLGSNHLLDPATATHIPLAHVGLSSAQGMAIDAKGKFLFILDVAAAQLVRVKLSNDLRQAKFNKFDLPPALDLLSARGIALNPQNRHVYVVHPSRQILYDLTQSGQLAAQYDLSALQLTSPRAAAYAPSPDLTDSSSTVHLFIADSQLAGQQRTATEAEPTDWLNKLYLSWVAAGQPTALAADNRVAAPTATQATVYGKIVEVALDAGVTEVTAASPNLTTLTLVQTINTAAFSPPSPDPSGITYIPATNILLVSDGEVDEMPPYFTGNNLFGVTPPGALSYTKTTLPYSNEPADVAYNPTNGHLFVADDNRKKIFEVNPGADGLLNTSDDIVTSFLTSAFNSMDPEGLAYDAATGHLFIGDGVNNEIYRVSPGANGIFDGVPAVGGDDSVTNFDTAVNNINDPEGIDISAATGNLILTSNNDTRMYEVTTAGVLVQTFDIGAANAMRIGGVAIAPSSTTPGLMNYYIVDRRVDNNVDPNENDGRIYEFTSGSNPPTATPTNTPLPTPTSTNGPTPTPTATPTPIPSSGDIIFLSSTSSGQVGAINFADEDILVYNTNTSAWSIYFDGSDVLPTAADVDAMARLSTGALLLSLDGDHTVGGLGLVDDSDIIQFTPTSLGTTTAGTFAWYFDGSDVELTTDGEDVDAFTLLSNGALLLSTLSSVGVTGVNGQDEDLLLFTPTELGETTSGAWSLYFDGSDVGLSTTSSEDVNESWLDPANQEIYLTTTGNFDVPGVSGDGSDIFICTAGSIGTTTSCTFRLYWDGSAHGFTGEVVDVVDIEKSVQQAVSATMTVHWNTEHQGDGDDPNADPDEAPDDVAEDVQAQPFYLPLIRR